MNSKPDKEKLSSISIEDLKLLKEALNSLQSSIAFSSRDWSYNHRDAWIWGIAVGWDTGSLSELKDIHDWNQHTIDRLQRYSRVIEKIKGLNL